MLKKYLKNFLKSMKVTISNTAEKDIKNIYDYILEKTKSSEFALKYYTRLMNAVFSLQSFPKRCPLVIFEPERGLGIRRLQIDRYNIFYIVGENRITVINILHSSSDIESKLGWN